MKNHERYVQLVDGDLKMSEKRQGKKAKKPENREHCGGNIVSCDVARPGQNVATLFRAARTQQMFLKIFRNIFLCPGHEICTRVAKRINIWETWSRQQCCHHNVSSFCRPLAMAAFNGRISGGTLVLFSSPATKYLFLEILVNLLLNHCTVFVSYVFFFCYFYIYVLFTMWRSSIN